MEKRKKTNLRKSTILKNKRVLLGVSGGVAAYKSIELARRFRDEGASVSVVMTEAAGKFVTPLSLETASLNKVYTSIFDDPMSHISLPADSDIMVVAPATANIIGKFAHGIADDLLSACFLAFRGSVIVAPAMNWRMYESPALKANLKILSSMNVRQVGPASGSLACGEEGMGRMAEVSEIIETARAALTAKDLLKEKIVVTAGPTREYIDPVRFISNRSSGKMGYAIAGAAIRRGAEVTLISGPSSLDAPNSVRMVRVETSEEMLDSVNKTVGADTTVLIMAAAVADFSPVSRAAKKIPKKDIASIKLNPTTDIISAIARRPKRPFIVGFSAETSYDLSKAKLKMKTKKMDMIVFNNVSEPKAGFDVDTNRVVIIDRKGKSALKLMSKDEVADKLFDRIMAVKT